MTCCKSFVFIVSIIVGQMLMAQKDAGREKIDPNSINDALETAQAGELVDRAFETFQKRKGIQFGVSDRRGRVFYTAKAAVARHNSDAEWAKSRTMAFEQAWLKAQAEFIRDMYGKQTVKMCKELTENQSSDAMEFPKATPPRTMLGAIWKKSQVLADARLNEKLEDMGIDPSEYDAKPKEQKKQLFMEALTKKIFTRAIGAVSGMVPVMTIEGFDGKGNHVIGVIAMYSPKLKQLAYDISRNRIPLLTGKPRQGLSAVIPTKPAILADQFGIRVLFDEEGKPCLIGYGQWSHNYTGKLTRKLERRREMAGKAAQDLADSYITTFLNGKLFFNSKREMGEIVEEFAKKDSDGNISEEEATTIIDKLNEKIKVFAKADMAGRGTFKKWSYKTKNGQEIFGVVRTWTQEQLNAAKNVRNWKPQGRAGSTAVNSGQRGDAGVRTSQDDMDVNDF